MERSSWRGAHWLGVGLALAVAIGMLAAGRPQADHESVDVASLSLTCQPVVAGVLCHLAAVSRGVMTPPRDVTPSASWRVRGRANIRLSHAGVVEATGDGDVVIEAQYAWKRARVVVRLSPSHQAQILAGLYGVVYVYDRGQLSPVAEARIAVITGPDRGTQTTTRADGSYELPALLPGELAIHVTKVGYTPADLSTQIQPGDNRVSPVLDVERFTREWVLGRVLRRGLVPTPQLHDREQS